MDGFDDIGHRIFGLLESPKISVFARHFNEVLSCLSTMPYITAWTVSPPSVSSAEDPAS